MWSFESLPPSLLSTCYLSFWRSSSMLWVVFMTPGQLNTWFQFTQEHINNATNDYRCWDLLSYFFLLEATIRVLRVMKWIPGYQQTSQCQKRLAHTTDTKKIRHDFILLVVLMKVASACTKGPEPNASCSSATHVFPWTPMTTFLGSKSKYDGDFMLLSWPASL